MAVHTLATESSQTDQDWISSVVIDFNDLGAVITANYGKGAHDNWPGIEHGHRGKVVHVHTMGGAAPEPTSHNADYVALLSAIPAAVEGKHPGATVTLDRVVIEPSFHHFQSSAVSYYVCPPDGEPGSHSYLSASVSLSNGELNVGVDGLDH